MTAELQRVSNGPDPHEPIVAATESDMDGALTMQIFKLLTGSSVLFADVRHYDKENNVWFFSIGHQAAIPAYQGI